MRERARAVLWVLRGGWGFARRVWWDDGPVLALEDLDVVGLGGRIEGEEVGAAPHLSWSAVAMHRSGGDAGLWIL